jgi:hypothetical protein
VSKVPNDTTSNPMAPRPETHDVEPAGNASPPSRGGVAIGFIAHVNDQGVPCIMLAGSDAVLPARSLCPIDASQRGRQCALLFENGDPRAPLILGLLQHPVLSLQASAADARHDEHGELVLRARHAIELQVGEASLRMSADGRIEIRGSTLVSHASGLNRIRGASVKLN